MTSRRRKLTDREKQIVLDRQGGKCPGLPGRPCGKPLTIRTAEFDHVDQRVFTKSDDLNEFQGLCRGDRLSCASIKTNGIPGAGSAGSDANKRAKIRKAKHRQAVSSYRQAVKAGGVTHASKLYPEVHRLMIRRERRKIRSRGFAKGKRPMRGKTRKMRQ